MSEVKNLRDMIDDEELEEGAPGHLIKRDVDGKFAAGGTLSSERAAEIGRLGGLGKGKRPSRAAMADEARRLIEESGWTPAENAPSYLKIMARQASSGRSGSVSAMRHFLAATGQGKPAAPGAPYSGEGACPTCGRGSMTVETARRIIDSVVGEHTRGAGRES